ncbi:MAG: WecB/TagA/CpsF family glycosyltransferase [Acidimicrobiales bacterium]|nr:WecB/TagA/CpsF family glycosyltransferase [Acidimicrobiales bacterium]
MSAPDGTDPTFGAFRCCGVRIDALTHEAAVRAVLAGGPRAVHLCNAYTLSLALDDAGLHAALDRGDLNLPDGMPLVWLGRRAGFEHLQTRVYGPDLMAASVDRGRVTGTRHFLYGSTPAVLDALAAALEARFPGARLVGHHSPPFRELTPAEEDGVTELVRATTPDIVWVGLGTPRQDLFVDRFRDRIGATLVAVGAAFDFLAGTKPQAPRVLQQAGLEWAYRLAREPRRLWRRYLIGNGVFLQGVARGGVAVEVPPRSGRPAP